MKYINKLLVSSMLIATTLSGMTSKIQEPKLIKGTSIGKYSKPGAPVNISYTTEHVGVGSSSEVKIILSTHLSSGTMNVKLHFDKKLEQLNTSKKKYSFAIKSDKKEFPLDFNVLADEDGLYYIKLLVSIKGKGMRAFSVPVYVGDGLVKTKKSPLGKTEKGEKISVSEAQETVIKE